MASSGQVKVAFFVYVASSILHKKRHFNLPLMLVVRETKDSPNEEQASSVNIK